MEAALSLDEVCPSCGEWINPLQFNYHTGWCDGCTQLHCVRCGTALQDTTRTTCPTCRQEQWLERHAPELEYLMIVKDYSFSHAKKVLLKMLRPICQNCGKPIKGASEGALFCGRSLSPPCYKAYRRYIRLTKKQGLTSREALDILNQ